MESQESAESLGGLDADRANCTYGYGTKEASKILGMTSSQLRAFVRGGFLKPARGKKGALVFSFQDLIVLKTARSLVASRIPPRRVKRALRRLLDQLPEGSPLTGVQVAAQGIRIVARDGASSWQPESGQALIEFGALEPEGSIAPLPVRPKVEPPRRAPQLVAEDFYILGCELEDTEPDQAREAYRRALEIEPTHARSLVNLGRLLHAAGAPGVAEAHYRKALETEPGDSTAAFNLGVVLEDQGRVEEAMEAYERSLALDPASADAHYNAALLYERSGNEAAALRHLTAYRRLTKSGS